MSVVEGPAKLLLFGLLDVVDLHHVPETVAPVGQLLVGQQLGVASEEEVVPFELQRGVEAIGVEAEVAAVRGVTDVGVGSQGALLPLLQAETQRMGR